MKRRWLFAAAVVAVGVAGCANTPYYDNGYGYNDYYNTPYATYPPYYVDPGPSVSFGFAYSDRQRDGRRWRDGDRHWDRGGDRHGGNSGPTAPTIGEGAGG